LTNATKCAIVELMKQTWLVVHPSSMLMALELVEAGESPDEVMLKVLDWAHASMEDVPDDVDT